MPPEVSAQPQTVPAKKPRLALLIATGFGLGYIPKAPGTAGSLGGIALALVPSILFLVLSGIFGGFGMSPVVIETPARFLIEPFVFFNLLIAGLVAGLGVLVAGNSAIYLGSSDPQQVVIDEISGQHLTLVLGGFSLLDIWNTEPLGRDHVLGFSALLDPNWKYLLLGFILFRVFDIWKPWPVRNAEKLPGGWGIMADDWVAGLYAAAGLWVARVLGL